MRRRMPEHEECFESEPLCMGSLERWDLEERDKPANVASDGARCRGSRAGLERPDQHPSRDAVKSGGGASP